MRLTPIKARGLYIIAIAAHLYRRRRKAEVNRPWRGCDFAHLSKYHSLPINEAAGNGTPAACA